MKIDDKSLLAAAMTRTRSRKSRHPARVSTTMKAPVNRIDRRLVRPGGENQTTMDKTAMACHSRILRHDIRPIVTCPFCTGGHGLIGVDTEVLVLARQCCALARHCQPEETINLPMEHLAFVFGAAGSLRTPCAHLVEITGQCSRESLDEFDGTDDWGAFAWKSKADLGGGLSAFYQQVVREEIEDVFQPRVPFHHAKFSIRWRADDAAGETWEHGAQGNAVFVASPRDFFAELALRHKIYRQCIHVVEVAEDWQD